MQCIKQALLLFLLTTYTHITITPEEQERSPKSVTASLPPVITTINMPGSDEMKTLLLPQNYQRPSTATATQENLPPVKDQHQVQKNKINKSQSEDHATLVASHQLPPAIPPQKIKPRTTLRSLEAIPFQNQEDPNQLTQQMLDHEAWIAAMQQQNLQRNRRMQQVKEKKQKRKNLQRQPNNTEILQTHSADALDELFATVHQQHKQQD